MKQNLLKTMLVMAGIVAGSMGAWADTVVLKPTQTTVIHGNDANDNTLESKMYYDVNAITWSCSYAKISGGAFTNEVKKWGGTPVVLTKFDASSDLKGKNLKSATLTFTSQCTVVGKNSNVQVAEVGTGWDATTATWATVNTKEILHPVCLNGAGVNVNTTAKELTLDVTAALLDNSDNTIGIGFAFYTATGREQAISGITLTVESSDEAIKPISYAVNLVDENNKVLKSVFSNKELVPGTKVDYVYPKYLTDDKGKVAYVCDANTFSGSVSPMEAGTTDVKYSAYKGTAYFIEAENAINKSKMESANYSSGAAMRGFDTNMDLLTIPETGVYRLSYAVCSYNVRKDCQFIVSVDDKEIATKDVNWSVNKIASTTITEDAMVFDKNAVIKAKGSNGNLILDYILLEKVTSEDVAVSAIKFATYVPTCNVVAPADVKVYTAKVNEAKSAVVLTEVPAGSVIAKGTPVLVGAEEGSYTFVASADEAATIENNDLKAAAADTKGDGATIYALVEQNGEAVFAPLKEGVAVSLGHAYLELPAASATRFYSIQFGGETTGINEVNAAAKADGAYYTLQGVKTSKAAKGIYIHNGKKVVIK